MILESEKMPEQPAPAPVRSSDWLDPLHVISLGAGVQSSVMALMAARGEITPMPTAAIFADTMAEPASVYLWLDWLEKQLPYPVLRVSKGNLTEMALKIREKKDGTGRWAKSVIPAYVKNPNGTRGIIQRQCTYDYKVVPLTRTALKLMKQHGKKSVVQWIGISLDEAHRMKPSRDARIQNRWPLIDAGMKRYQCLQWMEKRNLPKPPRSACVYCPYHSDAEWRRLKNEEPDAFAAAVKFDEDYRRVKQETNNMHGLPYLHNSLIPLRDVDFSTDEENGQEVMSLSGDGGALCEGMCGV